MRRFNAVFQARFGRPPTALRREQGAASARDAITVRLDFRPPLDWDELLGFLARRAIPGVEAVTDGVYRRTVRLGGERGWVAVGRDDRRDALRASISLSLANVLMPLGARLRALFDLDAHPTAIAAHLGRDPDLAPLVARRPGLRVPGAFDPFETAVRTVLGQQVSVTAATTLSRRLVARLGSPAETPFPGLDRWFPSPEEVAAATESEIAALGMPGARARTLLAVAGAFAAGLRLERAADPEPALARLAALPGVGDWTTSYLAMRALGFPDAFPASDLVLRKALGGVTAAAAVARAEAWRPFRAYAVVHLWTGHAQGEPR